MTAPFVSQTPVSGALAVLAALGFFFFLIAVAFYVIGSWFLMKIFDKAGVQGRWRAWVPVYNLLVFAKLGDLSPWVMLIAIAAFLALIWPRLRDGLNRACALLAAAVALALVPVAPAGVPVLAAGSVALLLGLRPRAHVDPTEIPEPEDLP